MISKIFSQRSVMFSAGNFWLTFSNQESGSTFHRVSLPPGDRQLEQLREHAGP